METADDKIKPKLSQKQAFKFYCKKCDYGTSKKSNYETHIMSSKHSRMTEDDTGGQSSANFKPEFCHETKNLFLCHCGNKYQYRQGLWKHKQKCNVTDKQENIISSKNDITKKDELIEYLMKENKEIRDLILELAKKDTYNNCNNNNNTTNTNSHNKAFNLNFFLNETCKNAMNITDFIDSIKIQLSDLERFGEVGYAEGISKIITSNLKALDVTERPIHCTDKKRETMYVKDNNKWEKEDENNTKLRKFIKNVSYKNIKLLPQFREKNPEYKNSSSYISGKYDKMALEAMGGAGDESEKENKIIHNISKCVIVDKLRDDE